MSKDFKVKNGLQVTTHITASGNISASNSSGTSPTHFIGGHVQIGDGVRGNLHIKGGGAAASIYRHSEERIRMNSDGQNFFYGDNGMNTFQSTDTSVTSGQNYISLTFVNNDSIGQGNAAIYIQATENHAEEADGGSKFLFNAFSNADDPTDTLSLNQYNLVQIDPNATAGTLNVKGSISSSGAINTLSHITASGNISGSSTSTGSFGHLMVGGGNFSSASLAAGGSGGGGAVDSIVAGDGIDVSGATGDVTITAEDASATNPGVVELATTAETTTGTDATRAVTPDGLKDGYQGSTNVTTLGTIGTGTWQGTAIASAYLDSDTAHLTTDQTFSGRKTFSAAITASGDISASGTQHTFGGVLNAKHINLKVPDGTDNFNYMSSSGKFSDTSFRLSMGDIEGEGNGTTLTINEEDGKFNFAGGIIETNGNISVQGDYLEVTNTTDSTDASGDTGALRIEGGASIAKKVYVGTQLSVGSHITSSGNISSSAKITGKELTLSGLSTQGSETTAVMINGSNVVGTRDLGSNAFTSTTIGTNTNALTVDNATLQLNSGTTFNGSAARTISIKDGGVDSDALAANISVTSLTSTHITASGNISASGAEHIFGGTGPGSLNVEGSVTASGNISGSSSTVISGQDLNLDRQIVRNGDADTRIIFETDKITLGAGGNNHLILNNGHITASGNISASGNIISTTGFTGGGTSTFGNASNSSLRVSDGTNTGLIAHRDNTLVLQANTADPGHASTAQVNIGLGGHITASGNYIGSRQFDKSTTTNNDLAQGDIIYQGGGSTTQGDIVYMKTDGEWGSAQADAASTATSLLGIALGTDPDVDGVLLRGTYTLDHDVGNNQGVPLYLSDITAGQATVTAPSDDGDIIRIIGYNLGDDDEIWFDPDKSWVEHN